MILDGRKRIQQKQQEFQKQQKQQEQEQKCQEYLPTKMREFKEEINGSNHFYFKI